MNQKLRITILILMLGMTILMPSISFAYSAADSTLLQRIWNYRRNYSYPIKGQEQNVYLRYGFNLDRRNFLLFLVPSMYVIAEGEHKFVGESYCKIRYRDVDDYDVHRQVVCGNIPRQRTAMPPLLELSTPDFYDATLYPDHVLSPFHQANNRYYKYSIGEDSGGLTLLHFRPKVRNTMLVEGHAVVDTRSGRLQSVMLSGEYDMVTFKVSALMNSKDIHSPLPERCHTETKFKFLGNHVSAALTVVYNCPETLPDSLDEVEDPVMMESLRPVPLNSSEEDVYRRHKLKQIRNREEAKRDTVKHTNWIKDVGWSIVAYNLTKSHKANIGGLTMRTSPLIEPQYISYSNSRGFSYKMKFGLQYNWNDHRYLTFNPQLGYSFKLRQIFYTAPLRMTYNPKRRGYAEIKLSNGNHISNGLLEDDFKHKMGKDRSMPDFKDRSLEIYNNVVAFDWLEIKSGLIYHSRESTNPQLMREAGMEETFYSFAPMLTVRLKPWNKGPVLTANFEKSFRDIMSSNLSYQRWEFDAVYQHKTKNQHIFNARVGAGFYTERNSNYFVDYSNFRDENLPMGWEDDWSGQFQLLNTRWYNASNYYLRGHVSYDKPMLALSYMPLIGRYIEAERLYVSALSIAHTRPYFEVGYGFANRFFSTGIFASFLGTHYQKLGVKITLEIFRRW
ncbi:MAG: hypothetical protein IJV38_03510 [Prevotella sp.]|nr:hypothetical protein [Prevotella sp.]